MIPYRQNIIFIAILVIVGLFSVAAFVSRIGDLQAATDDQATNSVSPSPAPNGITVCHATGSTSNPFVKITFATQAANGHFDNNGTPLAGHEEDILLADGEECPLTSPAPSPTTSPTPSPTPPPPENNAPTLQLPDQITIVAGQVLGTQITARDVDGDEITITLPSGPIPPEGLLADFCQI